MGEGRESDMKAAVGTASHQCVLSTQQLFTPHPHPSYHLPTCRRLPLPSPPSAPFPPHVRRLHLAGSCSSPLCYTYSQHCCGWHRLCAGRPQDTHAQCLNASPVPLPPLPPCRQLFFITILYTANTAFALVGLKTLNVPMYNTLKRLTPIFILTTKVSNCTLIHG